MGKRGKVAKQATETNRRSLLPWTIRDEVEGGLGKAGGEDLPGGRGTGDEVGDVLLVEEEDNLRTLRHGGRQ